MKIYTPQEWLELAKDIYDLALAEWESVEYSQEKYSLYIKFVYIVNYFRLLRGEAFHQIRPHGMGELQKELYKMEDDLYNKLDEIKKELNISDQATKYHLDEAKKEFDLT